LITKYRVMSKAPSLSASDTLWAGHGGFKENGKVGGIRSMHPAQTFGERRWNSDLDPVRRAEGHVSYRKGRLAYAPPRATLSHPFLPPGVRLHDVEREIFFAFEYERLHALNFTPGCNLCRLDIDHASISEAVNGSSG